MYNTQPHYNPPRALTYQNPPRPYAFVQATAHKNRPAYVQTLHPNIKGRNTHTYTPITKSLAYLFERLREEGLLYLIEE